MKHIEVEKIKPHYSIELSKEQLLDILCQYLSDQDVRLGGKVVTSYGTENNGYYLVLEERE